MSIDTKSLIDMHDRPQTRIFSKRNNGKFVELMESQDWDNIYTQGSDWYTIFITKIRHFYEKSFPLVYVSRKRLKDKPWISKGLRISIRKSHRLYRLSISNVNPLNTDKYKVYKHALRKCLKGAETRYYEKLFEDKKTSSYNLWKHLGPIINPNKKKKKQSISKMICDGSFSTDSNVIAEYLNNYFCNIGHTLQSKIPQYGNQFSDYLTTANENTFFFPQQVLRN